MSAAGSSAMSGASRWLAVQPDGALLSTISAASTAAAMRDRVLNRRGLIVCVPFTPSRGPWFGGRLSQSSLTDWYEPGGPDGFVAPRGAEQGPAKGVPDGLRIQCGRV